MIDQIFFNVFFVFALFGISLFVHEIGHLILLEKAGYNGKIKRSTTSLYIDLPSELNKKEKIKVLEAGIILGTLPILFFSLLQPLYCFLLLPYLWGCKSDIKLIARIRKFA